MKKEKFFRAYESPDIAVTDMNCEGVFCNSEYDTADYGYELNEMFEL